MDPEHTPGKTPGEPADQRTERPAGPGRASASAIDVTDAEEARSASRALDEGMPASSGLDDDREARAPFPALPGLLLREARESTVFLPYELVFRRLVDLPALIVWDGVTDPDMLSGWLAEATSDAEEGGDFWFEWMTVPDRMLASASGGVITRFEEGRVVEYTFLHEGQVTARFHLRLEEVPGGPRDRQTDLVVTVTGLLPSGIANVLKASWRLHLDLLEELVHGRPVDWDAHEADHGTTWRGYLAELESAEG